MHGPAHENLFFFDNGRRFPHLRKFERIPTEKLPEALQEFRLESGATPVEKSDIALLSLKTKDKNKQNVIFNERGEGKKNSSRKKRRRLKGNDGYSDFFVDFDVEDDGKFLFEEAKYSSTTILEQLGKVLQNVWERTIYQNNWNNCVDDAKPLKFEKDIKGFKWRFEITDKVNKKLFFLPDYLVKLIDVEYQEFCRVVQYKPREWQTQAYKDITNFSTGALKRTDSGIFSVPPTRMSELTCNTATEIDKVDSNLIRSKVLTGKSSNDSGMTHESDGPAIVAYRRESKTPVYNIPKPQVRHNGKNSVEKGLPPRLFDGVNLKLGILRAVKLEEEEELGSHTTKFSLSSKDCHEKGWITMPSSFSEHEKKAINAYIRKILVESVQQRKDEEIASSRIFIHPDVVIHYYGDAKRKAASLYQRHDQARSPKRKKKTNNSGVPFMVTLRDGSFAIYYPSGNICAVNSFVLGNPSSSYILVYGDTHDNNTILAHFTPSGRGVCYHKNGQISFISTKRYACCHDEVGALINKWRWTGRKLVPCYTLRLSSNLTFRCSNKDSMALFVNIDGESTKIKLAEGELSEDARRQQQNVTEYRRHKRRKGRGKEEENIEETVSKLSISCSELPSYETELIVLHKKFKDTVHRWMDHYRIAVGIKPPSKFQGRRGGKAISKSAGLIRHSHLSSSHRIMGSAPAKFRHTLKERGRSPPLQHSSNDGLISDDSAICLNKLPFRCGVLQSPGSGLPPKKGCPVVYRMQLMGITDTHCRCDRKKIPIITDIEFDAFIATLPKTQLVVVSIFKERSANPFDCTLNEIHYQLNKDRSYPCVQSSCDPFRLFRYPIPVNVTTEESALLIERHKVAAGMFIMYLSGKLLFSDYIFDGYGYTKKDFLNQVTRTRKEALDEKYLPDDFHFSPRSRSPSPQKIREYDSGEDVDAYYSKSTLASIVTPEDSDIKRDSCMMHENGVLSNKTSASFIDNKQSKTEIQSMS